MATLLEIVDLYEHPDLLKKVSAALVIETQALLTGTPSVSMKIYAAKVFSDPHQEAHRALKFVLAANENLTPAQITGAGDTGIRNNVADAILILADADAGV